MSQKSQFNFLSSHEKYRKKYNFSFADRFLGALYFYAGRLDKPTLYKEGSSGGMPFKSYDEIDNSNKNHVGVYDICTLFIPRMIEAFTRGNWLKNTDHDPNKVQVLFTIIPVYPVLWAVRMTFGLLLATISLPVIGYAHWRDSTKPNVVVEKVDATKTLANQHNLSEFNKNYKKMKAQVKIEPKNDSWAIKTNKYRYKALEAKNLLVKNEVDITNLFSVNKKFKKLEEGKYSATSIMKLKNQPN